MSIEKMDRAAAKRISAAMEEAAEMVAEDLGLEVKVGGGRFDPGVGTYAPKVEFSIGGAEEREFSLLAGLFGLKAEDYGREFTNGGRTFRLVGLNTRAPRFPVIGEDGGKRFKFTEESIRSLTSAVGASA